jgi:hypothetical protein
MRLALRWDCRPGNRPAKSFAVGNAILCIAMCEQVGSTASQDENPGSRQNRVSNRSTLRQLKQSSVGPGPKLAF